MRKIIESAEFVAGMQDIFSYIESKFGLIYTQKFLINTQKSIKTLAVFPEVGQITKTGKYVFHISRKNWIYYNFTESEMVVWMIKDSKSVSKPKK